MKDDIILFFKKKIEEGKNVVNKLRKNKGDNEAFATTNVTENNQKKR